MKSGMRHLADHTVTRVPEILSWVPRWVGRQLLRGSRSVWRWEVSVWQPPLNWAHWTFQVPISEPTDTHTPKVYFCNSFQGIETCPFALGVTMFCQSYQRTVKLEGPFGKTVFQSQLLTTTFVSVAFNLSGVARLRSEILPLLPWHVLLIPTSILGTLSLLHLWDCHALITAFSYLPGPGNLTQET